MNRIEFDKIRLKNFLSFGNTWQEFVFEKGINIIQGYDINTGKSNGSGKSSIMEAIPFALYGQTIKNIKKDKISNWFNNAKCEVEIYFHINGDEYKFYRSIKPNRFKVFKNDDQMPILSNVRDFQIKVNDEILGMDFKTFCNLIYFSPNNTISILDARKEQKRKFLESLFDLSLYSKMLKTCNDMLAKEKNAISLLENDINHHESQIDILNDRINTTVIGDNSENKKRLNFLLMKIESMSSSIPSFDMAEYDRIIDVIRSLNEDEIEYRVKVSEVFNELQKYKDLLESIDVSGTMKTVQDITDKIDELQRKINDIDIDGIADKMEKYKNRNTEIIDLCKTIESEKDKLEDLLHKLDTTISISNSKIKEYKNTDNLDGMSTCPVCLQSVDHEYITDHYTTLIKQEEDKIQILLSKRDMLVNRINQKQMKIEELTSESNDNATLFVELNDELKLVDKYKDEIESLQNMLDSFESVDELRKRKQSYIDKIKELNDRYLDYDHKLTMIQTELSMKNDIIERLEKEKDKYERYIKEIDQVKSEIDMLKERIKSIEDANKTILERIQQDKDELKSLSSIIEEKRNKISTYNRLIDHISYLKISLKDENIKQYAISSILPYLNKQTNYYLYKSGFPYSVKIDGWLDVEIIGFGVDDVSYASLSGGERKSIDIALQFASNDVSMLQARSSFNITILDEMIDSSFDSVSLMNIMDIIKTRQQDMDSCVYIITHKDEVKDFEFDSYISLTKKDGFSTITQN